MGAVKQGLPTNPKTPNGPKDSFFEGFWAQRPYYIRLLGYFEPEGKTPNGPKEVSFKDIGPKVGTICILGVLGKV